MDNLHAIKVDLAEVPRIVPGGSAELETPAEGYLGGVRIIKGMGGAAAREYSDRMGITRLASLAYPNLEPHVAVPYYELLVRGSNS